MSHRHIRLEQLVIREPCPMDWETMPQSGAGRFCSHCSKQVHDLTLMPRDDAERLVCESAGRLCIRMQYAADGTVVTLDYQQNPARRGWGFWTGIGLIGAIATWVIGGVLGRSVGSRSGMALGGVMYPPPLTATLPISSTAVSPAPSALPPSLVVTSDADPGLSRLAKDVPMELRVRMDPPTAAE